MPSEHNPDREFTSLEEWWVSENAYRAGFSDGASVHDIGPSGEDLAEARRRLAESLSCSQCGQPFSHGACGPTHAILAEYPERHALIVPFRVAAVTAEPQDAGLRARIEALLRWPVGRSTGDVDRLVPSSDLRAALADPAADDHGAGQRCAACGSGDPDGPRGSDGKPWCAACYDEGEPA